MLADSLQWIVPGGGRLVNTESEQPYGQKITVDYTALTEENALSVVWEGPSQEEAAKARDKYFSVVVLDSERQPDTFRIPWSGTSPGPESFEYRF